MGGTFSPKKECEIDVYFQEKRERPSGDTEGKEGRKNHLVTVSWILKSVLVVKPLQNKIKVAKTQLNYYYYNCYY